jgi:two-component system LytT family response regulator
MKAVIIDDEIFCTDVIKILLAKYCPEVIVDNIFNNSMSALNYLNNYQPDIIFLDIEMPHLNGFDLLKNLGKISSKIIFTTAYDQYAIKAFKFNAIDYLLKPIDKDELIAAVKKSSVVPSLETINHIQYLSQTKVPDKILLPIGNEIIFVQVTDIICCEAEGSYCRIYCQNTPKPYLLSKTLRDIEELLDNPAFFRPHASWLIQESLIKKIIKGDAMEIVLVNEIKVPVARSKRQEVLDRLIK